MNKKMKEKYIPTRKCISCQLKTEKNKLIRIAKTDDGFISDPQNIIKGRGAYVCKNDKCISELEKRNAVARAFKQKVTLEQYKKLTEELKNL